MSNIRGVTPNSSLNRQHKPRFPIDSVHTEKNGGDTVTQKELIRIASDREIMSYMREIGNMVSNLCYKSEYELPNAKRKIREYCRLVMDMAREKRNEDI